MELYNGNMILSAEEVLDMESYRKGREIDPKEGYDYSSGDYSEDIMDQYEGQIVSLEELAEQEDEIGSYRMEDKIIQTEEFEDLWDVSSEMPETIERFRKPQDVRWYVKIE